MRSILVASAACLVLVGCAAGAGSPPGSVETAPLGGPGLGGEEFLALVRGNSMQGSTPTGTTFTIYVRPDRTQRIQLVARNMPMTDNGRVFIENGVMCNVWSSLRNGQRQCPEVRRDGDTFRSYERGNLLSTFVIVPGNPDRL